MRIICPHPDDIVWRHYRTGIQNKNLAPVGKPAASEYVIRIPEAGTGSHYRASCGLLDCL